LQRLAFEVAGKLSIRRLPDIRYVDVVDIPMVWCAGRRPTIVLPMRLSRQLDDEQVAMILAHELAHLRRRDHWVRGFELIVSVIYWWNPLVWLLRRQIHHAEDLCCDGWVRYVFPDCTKRYAEVLLKATESFIASKVGGRLLPVSPFLSSLSLKARIEMILESRFTPNVSARSMFVIALLALFVVPGFVETTKAEPAQSTEAQTAKAATAAVPNPKATATPAGKAKATTSEFPYAVKFEQGATRFLDGDKITIVEVRGTAETFTPGNIYWIKGTYTLASHDRAMLAAYTTARDAAEGTGSSYQPQMTNVTKGTGTFTLFLPMSCRGWPHVSFYEGESFGGNYFGSGDSVLKQWWGSKNEDKAKPVILSGSASGPLKYPAVFVFYSEKVEPSAGVLFDTLYPKLTHHLTGRHHSLGDYQEQFTKWTKPGDTLILLLLTAEKDRVPADFQDLLPNSWSDLAAEAEREGAVRYDGESRKMHLVLVVAKDPAQLTSLVRKIRW